MTLLTIRGVLCEITHSSKRCFEQLSVQLCNIEYTCLSFFQIQILEEQGEVRRTQPLCCGVHMLTTGPTSLHFSFVEENGEHWILKAFWSAVSCQVVLLDELTDTWVWCSPQPLAGFNRDASTALLAFATWILPSISEKCRSCSSLRRIASSRFL